MILIRACKPNALPKSCTPISQASVRLFSDRGPTSNDGDITPTSTTGGQRRRNSRKRKDNLTRTTVFSGIQPTGVPHLGNYLGALRQWKQFQDDKTRDKNPDNLRLIYCIVDLHALTHQQSAAEFKQRRKETFASLLAIGLDPKHSTIFFQSDNHRHTQLMWYLSQVASTGYLSRMTQWKSKLGVSEDVTIEDQAAREKLRLGLFSYPVLQAADILLYNTDLVPVGEDQVQHVEFTRKLARSFNSHYKGANNGKDFFRIPNAVISPAKRIMSLKDPSAKMSKSHPNLDSRILLTDSRSEIHRKINGALTDSTEGITYDPSTRPGVSNLIEILKHVSNLDATCDEIAADNANQSMAALKEHVAAQIVKILAPIRDRFLEIMLSGNSELLQAYYSGRDQATEFTSGRIGQIEGRLGLSFVGHRAAAKRGNEHVDHTQDTSRTDTSRPPAEEASGDSIAVQEPDSRNDEDFQKESNREAIKREQELEEKHDEQEPDVTPQQEQGVDRPIAS